MRGAALAASVVLSIAATTACGGNDAGGGDGTVGVVASFYPLAEVAQRVGGDRVKVTNLTPAGGEPHDLELTSRDLDRIETADVVVHLGGGFQPAVEKVLGRADGEVIDVLSPDLAVLDAADDHDHGTDPHVWLDPSILRQIAGRVEAALAAADPAGAPVFAANTKAYGNELVALDREFQQGLAQCDRRLIVTTHASFGYLARRYNLTQEPISGLAPEAEPDPKRLADLARLVRSGGTTTVFYETLVSPRVAQTLARETGAQTAVLDPIEGLSKDDQRAGKSYASIMRENLAALRTALACR
ncbi:MAG: metal ABC transporter substrate-binding protein [Acidimicrobiales bacterium]